MINPNCTSGETYYVIKSPFCYDTYICTKQVFIPECDELIPKGTYIVDMRVYLNIFEKFFAWIMRYVAWEFECVSEDNSKRFRWMKKSTFDRYFELSQKGFITYSRKEYRNKNFRQFIKKTKKRIKRLFVSIKFFKKE